MTEELLAWNLSRAGKERKHQTRGGWGSIGGTNGEGSMETKTLPYVKQGAV